MYLLDNKKSVYTKCMTLLHKKKLMYNALLYRFVRAYKQFLNKNNEIYLITQIMNNFNKYKELFNIKYIYNDAKEDVLNAFNFINSREKNNIC